MTHDLTLWGAGTSRTLRAHWMLLELSLEYRFHPIQSRSGETHTTEFMQLNPRHKIPVLRHGSFVLTESAAIIQYLSETFANPAKVYVPGDARSRAALNEWCYFIMSELDAGSLYVVRRHEGLQQIYGEAPTAVEAAKDYFLHNLEAMASRIAANQVSARGAPERRGHPLDDLSGVGGVDRTGVAAGRLPTIGDGSANVLRTGRRLRETSHGNKRRFAGGRENGWTFTRCSSARLYDRWSRGRSQP